MSVLQALPPVAEGVRPDLLTVLIIDDERAIREACREVAASMGFHTLVSEDAATATRLLQAQTIDIVLLDLRLPGANGLEILTQVKRIRPEAIVIVITAYGSVQSAVEAMKHGAFEYLTKPFHVEELQELLERSAEQMKSVTQNRILREQIKSHPCFGNLIGRSSEMEKIFRIISKVAQSNHPVLVLGESGTGKELVARAIHFSGPNRDKPFIPVDCGSLVPTLIESELFGYVKGAFTGAQRSKEGLLSIANGGTVFLDEVGELPVELQAKLLRALQEREIRPVGSTKRVPINVRVVAATNRDLELAVQQGTFRRDLYFRLNVLNLRIPPLRERKQDIPLLIHHFMERINRNSSFHRTVSDEAQQAMIAYDWPGNVRELENCLERAGALSSGPVIHLADLPSSVQNARRQMPLESNTEGILPLAELEKRAILATLQRVQGDKMMASRLLGIGKTTLYRKLKEYGIHETGSF
jgi:two-component system response regulator HydG